MKDFEKNPPLKIVRGKGVYLYDKNGKAYFDAISSWWVNLFGHCNPSLNRALRKQSEKLEHVIFAGCTHEPALALADALVDVAPKGLSRVFYADNGSSAVEVALKMSFQYWKQSSNERKIFIALSGGYHGETIGALSVGGMPLYRKLFQPLLMDVKYAKSPDCIKCPYGLEKSHCNAECFASMEYTVDKCGAENVSAIIVEPLVQCANGMNMYPPQYLKKLRVLCNRRNIHFIADEIAVGFGRTGKMFACEHAAVSPDFLCLSKGITGGYMPFSAVLTREKIYRAFYADYSEGKAFLHSHSYTGNPLACSLALEVLRIFKDDAVIDSLQHKIKIMQKMLQEVGGHKAVKNFRQTGFIGAFDLVNNSKERMGRKAAIAMVGRGFLMRPLGDTLYLMPPLITSSSILAKWKSEMLSVLDFL
jgi:adenosylmethionine-8-amino-7-oxononanoate aminotransferase